MSVRSMRRIPAVALVFLLVFSVFFGTSVTADASFFDFESEKNVSEISNDKIIAGTSVVLTAASQGLNEATCRYAFYVRYENERWETLQDFGKTEKVLWTPEQLGSYQICIKIKSFVFTYKKYFKAVVFEELENKSLISSFNIAAGSPVTLYGNSEGGYGKPEYGYYYKSSDSDEWTTLSDFSSADLIQWTPQELGTYDICIKAADHADQVEKKYFTMTVSKFSKSPSSFEITVKAPLSAPYQWNYSIDDDNMIACVSCEEKAGTDIINPTSYITYRFTTVSAGATAVTLNYTSYSGVLYTIRYEIVVDKNLSYSVVASNGSYFDTELPDAQQLTGGFSVCVNEAPDGYSWKAETSDVTVAELKTARSVNNTDNFVFITKRSGYATIVLSCSDVTGTLAVGRVVYSIYIDENYELRVEDSDGYLPDDWVQPELVPLTNN